MEHEPPPEDGPVRSPLALIGLTALLIALGLGVMLGSFFLLEQVREERPAAAPER